MVDQREKIIIQVLARVEKAKKDLRDVAKTIKKTGATGVVANKQMGRAQLKVMKQQKALTQAMGKGTREFQGWALSIMFFGMALKRVFNIIWKSSTKTFQDVAHSVEGTVTQFDMLDGSLKFLQFTAGAALEPIAGFLIPIIDKVTDLISANEGLFRGIVIALAVGGTVLTALGMGALAASGFADAFDRGRVAWKALSKMNFSQLAGKIQTAVGVVAIGYGLKLVGDAYSDFNKQKFFQGTAKALGGVSSMIGGIAMIKGKGGGGLIALGVTLDLIGQEKFWTTALTALGFLFNPFIAFFMTLADHMGSILENGVTNGLLNGIKDFLVDPSIAEILKFFGLDVRGALDAAVPTTVTSFDFMGAFSDNFAQLLGNQIANGQFLDQGMANFMEEQNKKAALQAGLGYDDLSGVSRGKQIGMIVNGDIIIDTQAELDILETFKEEMPGVYNAGLKLRG